MRERGDHLIEARHAIGEALGNGIGAKIGAGFRCTDRVRADPASAPFGHETDELVVDFQDLGLQVCADRV